MTRIHRSLVVLAALVGAFAFSTVGAEAQGSGHWMVAKVAVDATNKTVTLERRFRTYDVNDLTSLLSQFDGSYVYAHVTKNASGGLDVDALAGDNPNPSDAKVQPATDDYSALTTIPSGDFFAITGQVQSEEEEGGLWYYDVPVSGGGTGGSPNQGYVLQSDVEIWSYHP